MKTFLFSFFLFFGLFSKGQTCFYDALKLREYIILKDGKPKFIIIDASQGDTAEQKIKLKEYCDLLNTKYYRGKLQSPEEIHTSLGDGTDQSFNPFLALYLKTSSGLSDDGVEIKKTNLSNSIFSSLGGIEIPSKILLGVTDFIVKRTKQELSIAFFEKFKETLQKPGYIDLQTVFPQTYKALIAIGDEIFKYQAYLQLLRSAFINDIDVLDENLPSIIENHLAFWNKHKELKATLQSAFYITSSLKDKVHPGDILQDYPAEYLDSLHTNWKASIQTLQVFSSSLRDTTNNKDSAFWISPKQVKPLVADEITFRIFLGLVYQKAKIDFPDSIIFQKRDRTDFTLFTLLDSLAINFTSKYRLYANYIKQLAEKTNKLNLLIKNHEKQSNDSIAFQEYYNYFNATVTLLKQASEISKLPYIDKVVPNLADTLKDYFDIARTTGNLVMDIKKRHYSSAITNAATIYDLVKAKPARADRNSLNAIPSSHNDFVRMRKEIVSRIKNANDLQSLQSTLASNDVQAAAPGVDVFSQTLSNADLDTIAETKNQLVKYGAFLAAVSSANSPDDVENAIETVALPSGSSRIKRESKLNVSLNAYCGLFAGWEKIKGVDRDKFKVNSYGVAAPIGISISRGHSIFFVNTGEKGWSENKYGWSTSLFLSIIDLGTVAAFRFKNDTTAQVPTVQLKDILSPGVFISLGIPKSPLSLNFGAQVGPNLRKIDNNSSTLASKDNDNKTYARYSLSVVVDIPLLNFYTKSK